MARGSRLLAALALAAGAGGALAGCGAERREPSQQDALGVARSVGEIVLECRSASAGFVAGPNPGAVEAGVRTLLATHERVRPDAPLELPGRGGEPRRTTLEQQMRFVLRRLEGCAPPEAARVREALEG